jgi:hypothetical protein
LGAEEVVLVILPVPLLFLAEGHHLMAAAAAAVEVILLRVALRWATVPQFKAVGQSPLTVELNMERQVAVRLYNRE